MPPAHAGGPASVQQQDDCDFTGMPMGLPRGAGVQQAADSAAAKSGAAVSVAAGACVQQAFGCFIVAGPDEAQ